MTEDYKSKELYLFLKAVKSHEGYFQQGVVCSELCFIKIKLTGIQNAMNAQSITYTCNYAHIAERETEIQRY